MLKKKNNFNTQNKIRNYNYIISKGIPKSLVEDLISYNIKYNKTLSQGQKTVLILCNCSIDFVLLDKICSFYIIKNTKKILTTKNKE
jgi:hypothetical protein